jgi:hypothetical protein
MLIQGWHLSSGPSETIWSDGWSTMSNQQAPSQTAAETAAMRHAARRQVCVNPAARCRKWLMAKHKLDRKIGEPCAVNLSFAGVCTQCTQHGDTQRHPYAHTRTFFHTHFLIWVLCRLAPCPNKQMFVQVPGLCCWLPVPSVGRQAIITVTWQMLGKQAVENWTHASYASGGCWTLNTQVFPARLAHCISLAYRNRVQLAASFVHMCQQLELRFKGCGSQRDCFQTCIA